LNLTSADDQLGEAMRFIFAIMPLLFFNSAIPTAHAQSAAEIVQQTGTSSGLCVR